MDWQKFENWKEVFDALEAKSVGKSMVRYMDGFSVTEVSDRQFFTDIRKNASAICRLGLQGKHIGLMSSNTYAVLVNLCAILYTGSVAVMINRDAEPAELQSLIRLADVDTLIFEHTLEPICLEAAPDVFLISDTQSSIPGVCSMESEREKGLLDIVNPTGRDDLVNILFTSGTTGGSKAVMHNNRSLIAAFFYTIVHQEYDAAMVLLPFHHVAGYGVALTALCQGHTVCLGQDLSKIIRYLEYLKPDLLFVVPALLQIVCQRLKLHSQEELGWNLRVIMSGGATCSVDLLQTACASGIAVFQGYGASETVGHGFNCCISPDNLTTLGRPISLLEAKLSSDKELLLRGPVICMGYYKDPVGTAETFIDGWYHTGDLARTDENGYFYLTGRKKNLIILSNGENVSPEEIESILGEHPEIQEILVQEEHNFIGAMIYPDYSSCRTDSDRTFLKSRVEDLVSAYNQDAVSYKQIHWLTITDEPLPKTASSKLLRH